MSFSVPTFNLKCSVWTSGDTSVAPRLTDVPCNLAWGRRVSMFSAIEFGVDFASALMQLLLPAGTDVRGPQCPSSSDWVEVPQGSSRFYSCIFVDDVGKGFANEHRAALLTQTATWPQPIP